MTTEMTEEDKLPIMQRATPSPPSSANSSILNNSFPQNLPVYTVIFDYQAANDDELSLVRHQKIYVISQDAAISGGEGWWTGMMDGDTTKVLTPKKIGIFPSKYVVAQHDPRIPFGMTSGETSYVAGKQLMFKDCDIGFYGDPLRKFEIDYNELDIGKVIGAGGFAKVHVAKWRNEKVAVKTGISMKHRDLTAIRNEACFFCIMSHPNIIQFKGVSESDSSLHLVMEYAEGGTLDSVLASARSSSAKMEPLKPLIVVDWALQIASGMQYLHNYSKGITVIHRDLKSSNILLLEPIEMTSTGDLDLAGKTLKITDFGLSRISGNTTHMSEVGTCAWKAPESIQHCKYGPETDVWSFGVVLWELLTGETPYKDMDGNAIIFGIGSNNLSLPIPSTCPKPFEKLLKECWDLIPRNRISFDEIINTLELLKHSSQFVRMPQESFRIQRLDWRVEIQNSLRIELDKNLHLKHENNDKRIQLLETERSLNEQARFLQEFQNDLLSREISLFYEQQRLLIPPVPTKRKGKFKKAKIAKLLSKEGCINISLPKDFQHKISVQKDTEDSSITSPVLYKHKVIKNPKYPTWGHNHDLKRYKHKGIGTCYNTNNVRQRVALSDNLYDLGRNNITILQESGYDELSDNDKKSPHKKSSISSQASSSGSPLSSPLSSSRMSPLEVTLSRVMTTMSAVALGFDIRTARTTGVHPRLAADCPALGKGERVHTPLHDIYTRDDKKHKKHVLHNTYHGQTKRSTRNRAKFPVDFYNDSDGNSSNSDVDVNKMTTSPSTPTPPLPKTWTQWPERPSTLNISAAGGGNNRTRSTSQRTPSSMTPPTERRVLNDFPLPSGGGDLNDTPVKMKVIVSSKQRKNTQHGGATRAKHHVDTPATTHAGSRFLLDIEDEHQTLDTTSPMNLLPKVKW